MSLGSGYVSAADAAARIADEGSPVLLRAVGRVFGLGEAERKQLVDHGIPAWTLVVVVGALGVVAGAWAHQRWPEQVDTMVGQGARA